MISRNKGHKTNQACVHAPIAGTKFPRPTHTIRQTVAKVAPPGANRPNFGIMYMHLHPILSRNQDWQTRFTTRSRDDCAAVPFLKISVCRFRICRAIETFRRMNHSITKPYPAGPRFALRNISNIFGGTMKLLKNQDGKIGWILLWALGIPIPVLLILFLLRGCT
jgi:hypothetical protein